MDISADFCAPAARHLKFLVAAVAWALCTLVNPKKHMSGACGTGMEISLRGIPQAQL